MTTAAPLVTAPTARAYAAIFAAEKVATGEWTRGVALAFAERHEVRALFRLAQQCRAMALNDSMSAII